MANPPKVGLYGKLCGLSKGFRRAFEQAEKEQAAGAANASSGASGTANTTA